MSNNKNFSEEEQRAMYLQKALACRIKCLINDTEESDFSEECDQQIIDWINSRDGSGVPKIIHDQIMDRSATLGDASRRSKIRKNKVIMELAVLYQLTAQ